MPTQDMWRVQAVWTGVAGSPYYATGHFNTGGGDPQDAADAWRTFLAFGTGDLQTPLTLNSITEVDRVNPVTNEIVGRESVFTSAVTYTSTADPLPPTNQVLCRWLSGNFVGGREVRGRTFLPGWTEAVSVNGQVDPALVTGITTKCNDLIADAASMFVIYSPKNGLWEEAQGASVWSEWAVLRSRRD